MCSGTPTGSHKWPHHCLKAEEEPGCESTLAMAAQPLPWPPLSNLTQTHLSLKDVLPTLTSETLLPYDKEHNNLETTLN